MRRWITFVQAVLVTFAATAAFAQQTTGTI